MVRHVTGTLLRTTATGALAGVVLSLGAQRHVEALVYEVRVTDAAVLWAPVAGVGLVALLASCLPVVQALRVDPCGALRSE